MNIKRELNDYWTITLRQALGFVEIIRLKLRILGFSNKRSSLMTKLGEAAFKSIKDEKEVTGDSCAMGILDEIREADKEISEAESAIMQKQEDGKQDREKFADEKWSRREESKPAEDIVQGNPVAEQPPCTAEPSLSKEETPSLSEDEKTVSQAVEALDEKENKQGMAS